MSTDDHQLAAGPGPHASALSPRIRFVLVRTSHPGNIGSAARAIRTMGYGRLVLVAPAQFPHDEATALAAGAVDVLERAHVVPDLVSAIADCSLVFGCTARRRAVQLPELTPRESAQRIASAPADAQVAIVFGNERTGLENDELIRCHAAVHIPADPTFSSLNLAQAVQVLAYELRLAELDRSQAHVGAGEGDPPATVEQLEHFFAHLAQTLDDIDFHKGRSPRTIMKRLRRLFLRADLDQRELRILRGIFDDAQRMARMAGRLDR
jgi:tRNA (cytidine32/uridine32-2'-O)-methyltransferase